MQRRTQRSDGHAIAAGKQAETNVPVFTTHDSRCVGSDTPLRGLSLPPVFDCPDWPRIVHEDALDCNHFAIRAYNSR